MNVLACPICNSQSSFLRDYPHKARENELGIKSIAECEICGVAFAYPLPAQSLVDAFYQNGSYWLKSGAPTRAGHLHSKNQALIRVRWIKRYIVSIPELILDIGAGYGWQADALKKEFPIGIKSYSFVEPDPVAVKSIYARLNKRFPIKTPKLNSQEKYDLVFLNQVLEHVVDPIKFVDKIKANMGKKCLLYLEIPNQDYKFKQDVFPHLFFYDKNSLLFFVNKLGLEVIALEEFGSIKKNKFLTFFALFIFRLSIALRLNFLGAFFDTFLWGYKKESRGIWLRALLRVS